ncbi:hypothetical protein M501DRAFT_1001684 [Patellaria atrata CBS 101060]|uniref:Uncharacterized protein n=1 Tax=Patellaria atrata CBS 101060 TaxID=1346257 RepID=A0A9P4SE39_9PEZI|nr:hypothetical protein M501DRAFT_1001684 [Patellaria atrata CBS 101060]
MSSERGQTPSSPLPTIPAPPPPPTTSADEDRQKAKQEKAERTYQNRARRNRERAVANAQNRVEHGQQTPGQTLLLRSRLCSIHSSNCPSLTFDYKAALNPAYASTFSVSRYSHDSSAAAFPPPVSLPGTIFISPFIIPF